MKRVVLVSDPSAAKESTDAIRSALENAGLSVSVAGPMNIDGADAVVLAMPGKLVDPGGVEALSRFVRNGGGLVALGNAARDASEPLARLIGARIKSHSPPFDYNVVVSDSEHPITHRVQDFRLEDELVVLEPMAESRTLLSAWWQGKPTPLAFVRSEGKGRVVYLANSPAASIGRTGWQKVFTRAARFAAGEDWSTKTVKVGVIGYGGAFNMGKLHAQSCERARMKPVAVCDVDPKRTATAKTELGEHIQTFTEVKDMLDKTDVEMCIVITPHNTHAPLSIQCLEAGRHVVTEKPYTITVDEATRVIETARRVKKVATVFHNRRWDGDYMTIKRIIDSGAIGEVFHIECFMGGYGEIKPDWWRSYKEVSGGAFHDWGAHFCDWVLNLMPYKIESIAGDFSKRMWHQVSIEDHTHAHVRFEGGRTASIEQSSIAAIGKARFRILGTLGGIEQKGWDAKDGIRVVSYKNGQKFDGVVPCMKDDWDGFYRNVADHLILGEPLAVTPESARKVIAVINLSEESSKKGGIPIKPPFEQ
jgi:predicted dehydrogenase/type 1 glutamine amidotransferase